MGEIIFKGEVPPERYAEKGSWMLSLAPRSGSRAGEAADTTRPEDAVAEAECSAAPQPAEENGE